MRTAIIAVHGVGGPERNATARAVADLLVRHGGYGAFHESPLTLPVAPLRVPGDAPAPSARLGGVFIKDDDRTTLAPTPGVGTDGGLDPPDVAFMRNQLRGYRSDVTPFDTVELSGARVGLNHADRRDVHVFEMYWADLSRVGTGVMRIFGTLFQLIQHLAQLGRKTLDVAAQVAKRSTPADPRETRALGTFAYLYALVVRLFTIGVPATTLLMLSFATFFLPAAIARYRFEVGLVAGTVAALVGLGVLLFEESPTERAASTFVVLLVAVLAGAAGAYWKFPTRYRDVVGTVLLTIVVGVSALGAYLAVLRRYDRQRRGALAWGVIALILVASLTAVQTPAVLAAVEPVENVRRIAFLGLQWSFVVMTACWELIFLGGLAILGTYLVMVRPALRTHCAQCARVKRAAWTARVTLAASVFSYIIAALVLYGAIVTVAVKVHAHFDVFPHASQTVELPHVVSTIVPRDRYCVVPKEADPDPSSCAISFFRALVAAGGTSGLVVALIGAGLSLLLVSWFVVLVAYSALSDVSQVRSRALGSWMTGGFVWLRRAGTLFAYSTLIAITVGAMTDLLRILTPANRWLAAHPTPIFNPETTQAILDALAVWVVASAATLAAFRARLDALATRARPVLGILLDVDNYLREMPTDSTPRARIAERYVSLLRHVLQRREGDAPYFDRVVIVAHSQGTVISADLLRFLKLTGLEPGLIDGRVRLMTMGSPLRQLYATHFPHLYAWIDRSDDDAGDPDDDAVATSRFAAPAEALAECDLTGRSPSPLWLGVGEWVNLFTTGDYVGRTLWRTEVSSTWTPQTETTASTGYRRRERCLGSGTHTHYWTAGAVAEELDRLIAAGAEHPSPGRPAEHTPAPR